MAFPPEKLNTIVIKIGTSLLQGRLAFEGQIMEEVVKELCAIKHAHDLNIVIVSSGAVGCGMNILGLTERPASLPQKQAVAAVGQATLMHYYQTLFLTYGNGLQAAQVLLTLRDLDHRESYLNARNTLRALFEMRTVVPIINENDSTGVEQLRIGDNDTLAARVAAKIGADLLIILSDVDGLYDKNPAEHPDAQFIERVDAVTPAIELMAGGPGTITSTGGMYTKLVAAKIAAAAGVTTLIANGHQRNAVQAILNGTARYTEFACAPTALSERKQWIAFGRSISGAVTVDNGARDALVTKGRSLLPAGVTAVTGYFEVGDAVEIRDAEGRPIARGLVNYSRKELDRIQGKKSAEIAAILGHKDFDEAVHRDNLVLL